MSATSTKLIGMAVTLVLFIYVVAALVPPAMNQVVNATGTAAGVSGVWGASIVSLWGILGIFIIVAIVLLIFGIVKKNM